MEGLRHMKTGFDCACMQYLHTATMTIELRNDHFYFTPFGHGIQNRVGNL